MTESVCQLELGQIGGCAVVNVVERKPYVFTHAGDIGDLIYSLPTVKALGGGVFYICPEHRSPMGPHTHADLKYFENLRGLLEQQSYIKEVRYSDTWPKDVNVDLNRFRQYWRTWNRPEAWMPIYQLHLQSQGVKYDVRIPWLKVSNPVTIPGKSIVINRTERYNNDKANLWGLVRKHHEQMVFIGTPEEYQRFVLWCHPIPRIPYHPTPTMLDVARVIAGSKVFVGGQSSPAAIAQGLGHRLVMEKVAGICQHAVVKRPGAMYFDKGQMLIPDEWLDDE